MPSTRAGRAILPHCYDHPPRIWWSTGGFSVFESEVCVLQFFRSKPLQDIRHNYKQSLARRSWNNGNLLSAITYSIVVPLLLRWSNQIPISSSPWALACAWEQQLVLNRFCEHGTLIAKQYQSCTTLSFVLIITTNLSFAILPLSASWTALYSSEWS